MGFGAPSPLDDADEYLGASGYTSSEDLEFRSLERRFRTKPDSGQKSETWVKDGKSSVKDLNKPWLWDRASWTEKFESSKGAIQWEAIIHTEIGQKSMHCSHKKMSWYGALADPYCQSHYVVLWQQETNPSSGI